MRGRKTHLNFILLRDTLSNAYNETDFVLNRLNYGVRGMWRGNVEHGRVRLYFPDGLVATLAGLRPYVPIYSPPSRNRR